MSCNKRLKADRQPFVGINSLTIINEEDINEYPAGAVLPVRYSTSINITLDNTLMIHQTYIIVPPSEYNSSNIQLFDRINGSISGRFETYVNGKMIKSITYNNGKKHGLCMVDKDGIVCTTKYLSDRKCGYEIYSIENKGKKEILAYNFYFDNLRHGLCKDSYGQSKYLYGHKVTHEEFDRYYLQINNLLNISLSEINKSVIKLIFEYINHYGLNLLNC